MRINKFLSILCAAAIALLSGCNTPEEPALEPSLEIENSEVVAAPEGGHYTVKYTLQNGTEGDNLTVTPEYDWVYNVDISVEGEISFDVDRCLDENGRSCRLDVSYPGIYPNKTILVKQNKGVDFAIELVAKEVKSTTITVDIIPQDKNMTYVMVLGNGDYMESAGLMEDDEALFEDYMLTFENMANGLGTTLEGAISIFLYSGDMINHTFTGVTPDTKYVLFAYGFDLNTMTRTTEVSRLPIVTKGVEDYIVHFDLKADVVGYNVTLDITPINYDGYFFFGVFSAKDCPANMPDSQMRELCEAAWEQEKAYYSAFFDTPEEGLNFIFKELAYKRHANLNVDLDPDTEYVLWAFGMNDEALLNTTPERLYFTTGSVAPSENTFTLSATDITARGATLTVETSNNDSYVAMLATADRFAGQSDAQIMEYITTNLSLNYVSGTMSTSVDNLSPNTEYQLLVFGCEMGVPTTRLNKLNFTTTQESYANLAFEIRIDSYFDAYEVAANFPNWADYGGEFAITMPTVIVDEAASCYYYSAMDSENIYIYSDEEIMQSLLSEEPASGDEIMFIPYDTPFVFVGFAVDENGNFTKLWKSKPITLTYDKRTPIEEFVDPLAPAEAPSLLSPAARPNGHTIGGLTILN